MNQRKVRVQRHHLFPNFYHGLVMFLKRKYLIWWLNRCENHCCRLLEVVWASVAVFSLRHQIQLKSQLGICSIYIFFSCAFVSHTMQVCITRVQMRQARQAWVEQWVFWFFFCFNLKRILWVQKCRQCILAAWQSFQFNLFTKVYLWELPYIAFLPQKPSLVQSIFVKTVLIFMVRRLKSFRS